VSTRICVERTLRAGIVVGLLILWKACWPFYPLLPSIITVGFLIRGAVLSLLALLQFWHVIFTPAAHRSSKSPLCG
jgi:hypothetical protein